MFFKPEHLNVIVARLDRLARERFGLTTDGPVNLGALDPILRARLMNRALSQGGTVTAAAALLRMSLQGFQYWEKQTSGIVRPDGKGSLSSTATSGRARASGSGSGSSFRGA